MSVEHIDFYGVDRATRLPIFAVDVPTRYFFVAAPILIAAIYCYLHLYLIRLSEALGKAPARVDGVRLGDAVAPWLITDAALHFRRWRRRDNSAAPRTLERISSVFNVILAWGLGPFVLAALFYLSLPARDFWITVTAGVLLCAGLMSCLASLDAMFHALRAKYGARQTSALKPKIALPICLCALLSVVGMSYTATEVAVPWPKKLQKLQKLQLRGEQIFERPAGWVPYHVARKQFRVIWCQREAPDENCIHSLTLQGDFKEEFEGLRRSVLADMRRPDWNKKGRRKPDFRNADLVSSFLVGANLEHARLQGANLNRVKLEGAQLRLAKLDGASLKHAWMEMANLRRAELKNVSLNEARLEGAVLNHSNLTGARMVETRLINSQMEGTTLHFVRLAGKTTKPNILDGTDLRGSTFDGGVLRHVDLRPVSFDSDTDFRNAFLDGSVRMSDAFRVQMGDPCQMGERSDRGGCCLFRSLARMDRSGSKRTKNR